MIVFIVGHSMTETVEGIVWEFEGVFSTYEAALARCKTAYYWIMEVGLDEELPEESYHDPRAHYPLAGQSRPIV